MVTKFDIIKKLNTYSDKEKAMILEELSGSGGDVEPIEIDNKVYYIPIQVHKLIDDLVLQIREVSSLHFPSSKYNNLDSN